MIEVDRCSEGEWNALLSGCRDATIYQSWAWGEARAGKANLCHIVLRRNGRVTGAAQARILRLPVVRAGIASVYCGPLWRLCEPPDDPDNFRQTILCVKEELAVRRGLLLRISPAVYDVDLHASEIHDAFEAAGFRRTALEGTTLLLDLSPSLEELRSGLDGRWRANLRKAEALQYQIVEGTDAGFYERFVGIYGETLRRKGFRSDNLAHYRLVQEKLPDDLKPLIILCLGEAKVLAGLIVSKIGEMAIALLAATSDAGTKLHVSHLVWWHAIQWLKAYGVRRLDLGGVNPEGNPGGYQFKHGLSRKYGVRASRVGRYEVSTSRLSSCGVCLGEYAGRLRERLTFSGVLRPSRVTERRRSS